MADHSKTFSEDSIDGSTDKVSSIDDVIDDNQVALNERYSLEHYSLDGSDKDLGSSVASQAAANAQGRHKPGHVSTVLIGSTSAIATDSALHEGSQSGALSLDTDKGLLQIHNGTNWEAYQLTIGETVQGFGGFPNLNVDEDDIIETGDDWHTPPGDLSKAFTANLDENWGDARIGINPGSKNHYVHIDLGTVHRGFIEVLGAIKRNAGLSVGAMYGDVNEDFMSVVGEHVSSVAYSNSIFRRFVIAASFWGRYPTVWFHTGNNYGFYQIAMIRVFGTEV